MQGHKPRGMLSVCIRDENGGWCRGQKRGWCVWERKPIDMWLVLGMFESASWHTRPFLHRGGRGGNGNARTAPPIDSTQSKPRNLLRRHISEIINYSHGGTNQTHINRQLETSLQCKGIKARPQIRRAAIMSMYIKHNQDGGSILALRKCKSTPRCHSRRVFYYRQIVRL